MTISRAQRAFARGVALLGREFGLGGSLWNVYAESGDGVTATVVYATVGTWTGFVRRASPTREAISDGGPVVAAEQWIAHGATAGVVQPGRILVSQADPTRAYRVGAPVDVAGYVRWQVAPCAVPSLAALLLETSGYLLTEDGGRILLEAA